MTSGSVRPLVFRTIRPAGPAAASASMAAITSLRVVTGDTTRRRRRELGARTRSAG